MSGTDGGADALALTSAADPAEPTDGRVRRATRSRQLVVETFLDLLDEGEPQPTAQQVATRSGVSMRSIFRLFDDVEAMHTAAIATQISRVRHLLVELPHEGPLDGRIAALVASRAESFEVISPVRRMAVRLAPTSRPIRTDLDRANVYFRTQVEGVFAPELSTEPARRRRDRVDALDVVTSWETWERLRTVQHRSVREATRIVTGLVERTLAG
jgi:AcrR family transcriptional regulator